MDRIKSLYNEWISLQPIRPEDRKRLDEKFKLEFNYNSNHLEGNTLTYGQTQLLLLFGLTSGDAPLKDYEEMKAHNVGLEMIRQEAADKERPLSEPFIRNLNQTILVQNYWKPARTPSGTSTQMEVKVGEYKSRPNSVITVTGEVFEYASPEETPAFMADLVRWYNEEEQKKELHPIELAALLHYRYIRIHPFEDGNGRIARLLVNYVLARHNYPMVIIKSEDKQNYLNALHKCDITSGLLPFNGANATKEQINPFTEYMIVQLERAMEVCIKAAKGESIEEPDDFAKRIAILEKQAKNTNHNSSDYEENLVNLLKNFLIPLQIKIEKALKPINTFFGNSSIHIMILEKQTDVLGYIVPIFPFKKSDTLKKHILNAKVITSKFNYSAPKKEYHLSNVEIKFEQRIQLETDHYFFNHKKFSYGQYPSEEEQNQIISGIKKKALADIESAILK